MASINVTQIVPIDLTPGASAVDYTPDSAICPILSITCIKSEGSGEIKFTPYRAAELFIEDPSGINGRLRIQTNAKGNITSVEVASQGSGYTDGTIEVKIQDAYGTGGKINCIIEDGKVVDAEVVSPGINYTGYVILDISDFIEGVTYDYMPKFIEQVSGSGELKLFGNRLAVRPYQVF